MGWFGIGESVLGMIDGVLDKIIPDAEARDRAKYEMRKLNQEGELKELETRMSAILAEARSDDPWTSRARPSFLYVIYVLILTAIPMGILSFFNKNAAFEIADGFNNWLLAIPSDLYYLFGVGYLGYTGARSWQEAKKNGKG